jgi:type I restriction enzyme R subunit
MAFNENTRVKIPAILHLTRLGYGYLSLDGAVIDGETNIFTDIFFESLRRINEDVEQEDLDRTFEDIKLVLENEDLGQQFYEMLTSGSGIKLIDFKDFSNNTFNVVTELTYQNGEEEFRPDITLLINGMPLVFIEVKKPNNREGILAERERINVRFQNKKLRKFINISQILMFTNNMEYDEESIVPIQGAFYSTTSYKGASFSCFREEEKIDLTSMLSPASEDVENFVLKDTNLTTIKHSPEFTSNKEPNTPTNRLLTSLFSKDRLAMLLKYSIAYVNTESGLEKHIMRYPQLFATREIERKLKNGVKKGIIWHTQGSGKTALAYYNVHYLTDYFQKIGVIPKFYFIVDRIDLLDQAKREFSSRGLIVHTVSSKDELLKDFKDQRAILNLSGKREITVVNIHKFKDDPDFLTESSYDINTQRVYFLDEVHRSYDPKGSFLANLYNSDRSAIMIGLTGTPLIGTDRRSRDIFGDYIHTYYYNSSIKDGYTLKLIREGIETNYKIQLEKILQEIEILKGDVEKRFIYSHPRFVEPMLDYIIDDLQKSKVRFGDFTIGAMVVCDSSDQAKQMFDIFAEKYENRTDNKDRLISSLILHDVGTKEDRKQAVEDFKDGKIDILFVYNMLLTGFDAKRLKKLYMGRVIRNHNLLQTLTRVNRPYKDFRYGFVVDFADIRKEFDLTNKAYLEELQMELGDEMQTYSNLFKSKEEIEEEIEDIKEKLFHYDLENAEVFSQQISQVDDRKTALEIKKALENAKNLYNVIRLYGHFDLLDKTDFKQLNKLYNEASRHLDLMNFKDSLQNNTESTNLLNVALENVYFMFRKVSEEEMVIADQLKDMLKKTREALAGNFDKDDPEFISLYEELKRLFKQKNLDEITQEEMQENIGSLRQIYEKVLELNRKNNLLKNKYKQDEKYARIHKRIIEHRSVSKRESELHQILVNIKDKADDRVLNNTNLLNNEGYFEQMMMPLVINGFETNSTQLEPDSARFINTCVVNEYVNEFRGGHRW